MSDDRIKRQTPNLDRIVTVQRFRKKPVEIEAMRWDGTAEGSTPVIGWILAMYATARYHDHDTLDAVPFIAIDTLEGTMRAAPGDWIIRGVKGEFYPCKPDIFAATYDPVPSSVGAREGAQR